VMDELTIPRKGDKCPRCGYSPINMIDATLLCYGCDTTWDPGEPDLEESDDDEEEEGMA